MPIIRAGAFGNGMGGMGENGSHRNGKGGVFFLLFFLSEEEEVVIGKRKSTVSIYKLNNLH